MQAYRALFTGPTSALQPAGVQASGGGTLSQRHDIIDVRPEYLVYVFALVCSSRSQLASDVHSYHFEQTKVCLKTNANFSKVHIDSGLCEELRQLLVEEKAAFDSGTYAREGEVEEVDENIFSWYNR